MLNKDVKEIFNREIKTRTTSDATTERINQLRVVKGRIKLILSS